MIWKIKIEPKPVEGDLKVVTKFAWLPKAIGDRKVWLENYQPKRKG